MVKSGFRESSYSFSDSKHIRSIDLCSSVEMTVGFTGIEWS